jgi:hypothetical protein
MQSKTKSRFGSSSRFKSIPDGRRVFLVSYPWTGYFVIPDSTTEDRLARKTLWEYLLLILSLIVIIGVVWLFKDSLSTYAAVAIPILFFALVAIIRWVLYRNELNGLSKIDYSSAVSSSLRVLQNNLRSHSNNAFPNYEIGLLLDIPDSQEKIVMLKYTEPFANILRCQLNGFIVWQAELPAGSDDVYTNIEWKDQKLHAFSRSCSSVLLDENTGRILSTGSIPE